MFQMVIVQGVAAAPKSGGLIYHLQLVNISYKYLLAVISAMSGHFLLGQPTPIFPAIFKDLHFWYNFIPQMLI